MSRAVDRSAPDLDRSSAAFSDTRQALTLDGKRYTLIPELPPGPCVFGAHDVPGLGITIAILSSGLICYLLARSVTSPVTRLRSPCRALLPEI